MGPRWQQVEDHEHGSLQLCHFGSYIVKWNLQRKNNGASDDAVASKERSSLSYNIVLSIELSLLHLLLIIYYLKKRSQKIAKKRQRVIRKEHWLSNTQV